MAHSSLANRNYNFLFDSVDAYLIFVQNLICYLITCNKDEVILCQILFPFQNNNFRGAEVNHQPRLGENKRHCIQAQRLIFSNWIVCFVRLIQLRWARPYLIKVFCSVESHTGREHAEAPLFFPSITSTVITFVYSGGNGSCLIRSY